MEAVVKYGYEDGMVELRDMPIPEIGPNDVLLKVMAAGICGSDIEMWRNKQSFPVNTPVILGHEFSGVIEKAGEEVKGFRLGDKVVSETAALVCGKCRYCRSGDYNLCPKRLGYGYGVNGAFTDFVKVRQGILHQLPENISFEEGAMTEPLCVAYNAVSKNTDLHPSDSVAIIGPGPIGLNCLQMANLMGAGVTIVIGTNTDTQRLNIAKSLGADICINNDEQDVLAIVLEKTNGQGVDIVVNAAGNAPTMKQSFQIVRRLGQIVKVGWGPEPLNFSLDPLISKSITLRGSFSHNWQIWENVIKLMEQGKLQTKPLISNVFKLSEWKKGFELMESKKAIKVALIP
jgi:L-iditol 2-dehydrogenase